MKTSAVRTIPMCWRIQAGTRLFGSDVAIRALLAIVEYPCDHTDMPTSVATHPHPVDKARVATASRDAITADDAARLASLLGLLADPVRVRILYALNLVDELCVGDIGLALDATEDAVGYGLRMLRTAGLVQPRKEGRVVYYRLADRFPEPLLEHCLKELLHLSAVAAGLEQLPTRRRSARTARR